MSIRYRLMENLCFFSNRLPGGGIKGIMTRRITSASGTEKPPAWVQRRCCAASFQQDGFPVHVFSPRKYREPSDRLILYLHGGGGMSRPTAFHYDTVCRLVKQTETVVVMPFYPLAPRANVREALAWLWALYENLMERYKSDRIIFAGDSAGANLALSLAHRLSPENRPKGLIAISPAFGLANGASRDIRLRMEPFDPILSVEMNDQIATHWGRGVPLYSPEIDPSYADYTDFPKPLFLYGTHELFYPHVKSTVEKIKQVAAIEVVEAPLCHDFALCAFLPEGRRAIDKMVRFINISLTTAES